MTTIVGVDFSGHREDRNTWVALGRLDASGALRLDSVQPARRADLYELLATIPTLAVAALDFPFGVPADFVAHLSPKFSPRAAPIKMRQVIFTHTSGPVPRHAVLGVGGCPITRGRGSARGLAHLGLVSLLYELQSRTGAGGSEKGSRRAMPVR